jgi:NAD(P)H-hydrate epimerase
MQPTPAPLEDVTTLPALAPRPADANKGNFGRVLVAAGSRGMSGAAVLCGSAALRGGAGLVYVAVAAGIQPVVAAGNPCYITAPLPDDADGRLAATAVGPLLELAEQRSAMALGPGLGRGAGVTDVVLAVLKRSRVPLVLDADGLNALAGRTDALRGRPAPLIITPHPGEFSRLVGVDIPTVQSHRRELAARFAVEHGLVLLLKGHGTLVTDGRRMYRNTTGNPGMATAGSGDVLTGLIAALVGQGLEPFAAAQLGAHVHGRAGDLARDDIGEVGLIASDLLTYLPRVLRRP